MRHFHSFTIFLYEITKEEGVTSPWRRLADITSILISKGTGQNHTPSEDAMRKPQGHFWAIRANDA